MGVMGDRCRIEDCYFRIHTYGHGLHMHGAQETIVRGVRMLGDLRPTDAIYEESTGLAARFGHKRTFPPWLSGQPIPRGEMLSLTEDGIRAYNNGVDRQGQRRQMGMITVEDCFVERMRGGITITMATGGTITGCTVFDCGGHAYSVPSGGLVRGSQGNAAYGPLLFMPYSDRRNADIEPGLMRSPWSMGDHPLAAVVGSGHKIMITPVLNETAEAVQPIVIGSAGDRYADAEQAVQIRNNRGDGIELTNLTLHPVELTPYSSNYRIATAGRVENHGTRNRIERVNAAATAAGGRQ